MAFACTSLTLATPWLSMLQVIHSAHCITEASITHQQQSSGVCIKGSLQMPLEALVSILHFKEYKDYLGMLPWIGTHFSAFLVSAILHLNMASGFLLTENHIPSTVTRKGWGGVFLWVTEKHCLRNGNTALLVIQPLFLFVFSVKYNKNIVGKYIVNYLQWKGYTIHWQRLLEDGATSCRLVLSFSLWLKNCRTTNLKTKYKNVKCKKPVTHLKNITNGQKNGQDHYDCSCCVGKALWNRKGDVLGSENVVSIKLKSVATLPLATVSPGFLQCALNLFLALCYSI